MKVIIPSEIYAQIDYYVQICDVEVSGLGRIKLNEDGDYVVTSVYLPKQENTSVTTELDEDAIASLLYTSRKDEGTLNFWWHSHVDMATNWSGTDHDTMEEFGSNGFLVSTVFNKRREMRSCYYQAQTDILAKVKVDNLETEIKHFVPKKVEDVWAKQFKENCKEKVSAPIPNAFYPTTNRFDINGMPEREYLEWEDREITRLNKGPKLRNKGNTFTSKLNNLMSPDKQYDWLEYCAMLAGDTMLKITPKKLYKFIMSYNCDFEAMELGVVNELSLREQENAI
jgi:hypothetical protein